MLPSVETFPSATTFPGGAQIVRDEDSAIFWRDHIFHGTDEGYPDARVVIASLEGWEELPDAREAFAARPNAHGAFDGPILAGTRQIMVSGWCRTPEERDALLRMLGDTMTFGGALEPLTIVFAGRALTVQARLRRYKATTAEHWASGVFPWAAEWVAPDPVRYGLTQVYSTSLPVLRGGMEYPLHAAGGDLEYGAASTTGRVTVTNPGSADTWDVFRVQGPLPLGFTITDVGSGRRLVFGQALPAGAELRIDTARGNAGGVILDGTAARQLVVSEWAPVPAGGTVTWAFSAPTFDPVASMTVEHRPGWW